MNSSFLDNGCICLRALEPEDLELMYEIENNTEVWDVSAVNIPYSRYTLKEYIANSRGDIYYDRQLRLIIERKDDGRAIGILDLFEFDPLHNRAAVGIVLLKKFRQKGYARQALMLLCDYSFGYLHLRQLYAHIPADNSASLKLFTSCCFIQTGVLKDWVRDGNTYKDAFLLQCVRKEG